MARVCSLPHALAAYLLLHLVLISQKEVQANSVVAEEVEHCDLDEPDNAKSSDKYDPSFCQEVLTYDTPDLYNQDDYNILAALATSVLNKTYPSRLNTLHAFAIYDEMPHPVPTGASSYFMVLFTVIFTWYFNKFIHRLFLHHLEHINLFPVTDHFPNIKLYMLQQSRRESLLHRNMRNTWAWLARTYLLQPSDPLVNPDEVIKAWTDFHLPQNVWAIIKAVLRVNALDESQVYFHDSLNNERKEEITETIKEERQTMSESAIPAESQTIGVGASWNTFKPQSFVRTGSRSLQELKSTPKQTKVPSEDSVGSTEHISVRRSGNQHNLKDDDESVKEAVMHYSSESIHNFLGFWKN